MKITNLGKFEDERGILTWASPKLLKFDFIYMTMGTMKKGSKRGGHYHKKMHERLICVKGNITFFLEGEKIMLNPGDVVNIPPNYMHTLYNDGEEEAFFVELKSEEFNFKKDDTYAK